MRRTLFLFPLLLILFFSCEKDIDDIINYSDFSSLNDSSLYTTLSPSGDYDYFELRWNSCGVNEYSIVYSVGERCSPGSDTAACRQQFDSTISDTGFAQSCLPACCQYYFVSREDTILQTYGTPESVISFLKPIDTPSDALMVARTQGYWFRHNDSTAGGIRDLGDKYQLIVTRLVSYCAPIQVNRYLLEVNSDGEVEILESDVLEKGDGCI